MSRRRAATRRKVLPDAKYGDKLISKFIQCIMMDGKKSIAEKIVYTALSNAEERVDRSGSELFKEVVETIKPLLEVKSRRVGGATYQVPTEVRAERAQTLAFRWLINISRKRSEKTMIEKLTGELLDVLQNKGATVKKREDTHKMAEANKAFAHFRW